MAMISSGNSPQNKVGKRGNIFQRFRSCLTKLKLLIIANVGTRFLFNSSTSSKSNSSFLEKVESMPIPDEAFFVKDADETDYFFGDIRRLLKLNSNDSKIELAKKNKRG